MKFQVDFNPTARRNEWIETPENVGLKTRPYKRKIEEEKDRGLAPHVKEAGGDDVWSEARENRSVHALRRRMCQPWCAACYR